VSIPVTTNIPVSATSFLINLKVGVHHPDVKLLQQFLNNKGYIISTNGSGSKGNESDYFGPATKKALIRYQIDNRITPAQGYFGQVTRDKVSGRKN
jgi:peptidoglycan hydrolase-like protein with peptidoglycan-binding domain